MSIPAVLRVAADAGELDPEALAQLNEDPAQAEKKSKKYEMKLKDLRNKYKVTPAPSHSTTHNSYAATATAIDAAEHSDGC